MGISVARATSPGSPAPVPSRPGEPGATPPVLSAEDEEFARQFPGAIVVARDLSNNTTATAFSAGSPPNISAARLSQQSFSGSADLVSVIKAVTVSAASSILSGYDQGVIAAAMLTMQPALGLGSVEEELSIGVVNIAAAAGGLIAGLAAERYGRKMAICLANAFFLVGSLAIAAAQGFWLLFLGRVLQGVGVGFALVVAPVFTAELVPANQRGMLVSLSDCSTNLGILLGYSSGLVFLTTPNGWRWMFAVGGVPAIALILIIWIVPESPRWLVSVNRDRTALSALNVLYSNTQAAHKFFADIRAEHREAEGMEHSGSWRQVFWHEDRTLRGMIWRGLAIAFLSQAMGTEAVVYYTPKILREAGIGPDKSVLLATMAVGGVKLLVLLVASQLFDRLGRRPLLLASAAGLMAGLLAMAAGEVAESAFAATRLAIVGLCVYMAAFSLGFSPLTYVMCSELFPSSVRARAMSLALFTARIVAGVIASTFVSMREGLGGAATWLFFVPISLVAFLFVYFFLPETRGYTLEDIVKVFRKTSGGEAAASAGARGGEQYGAPARGGPADAGGRAGTAGDGGEHVPAPSGALESARSLPPPSAPEERPGGPLRTQARADADAPAYAVPAASAAEPRAGGGVPDATAAGRGSGERGRAGAPAGTSSEQGELFEDALELPPPPSPESIASSEAAPASSSVGGAPAAAATLSTACAVLVASAQQQAWRYAADCADDK